MIILSDQLLLCQHESDGFLSVFQNPRPLRALIGTNYDLLSMEILFIVSLKKIL